jgi:hypothetical protein
LKKRKILSKKDYDEYIKLFAENCYFSETEEGKEDLNDVRYEKEGFKLFFI